MSSAKTILLVEDDPAMHEVFRALLATTAWELASAVSGFAALGMVEARPYDLVITDVRMPGMDGIELLRRIREMRPGTKVIVMTADNTPQALVGSLRELAYTYISKPFSPAAVVELIEQALADEHPEEDIQVLSAQPHWIALHVRCRPDVADRLVQYFSEMKVGLPAPDRENIATAFREMLRNAIEHGGKCDPRQKVFVAFVRTSRAILYYIRDPGEGFSMSDLPHAAVAYGDEAPTGHIQHRAERGLRPGGFGILLVRKLVDELIYNEKGNEVLMVKYL
jgi:CheY-like chemotaxis protein/anti-sigma regulatory factor (Ser/Thr protein kinase)